jgi:hypothetical protein
MLLPARIRPGSYFLLGSCSGSPAFSFASLKPGFEEFKVFLGHTFSVSVAVFHHAEDGDGDQVGHKHEHLDPLNPSTNHLTALQDLQVGQELSCSVLYFANFYEKVGPELSCSVLYFAKLVGKNGPRLCFGLPAVVEDVQDVTGYGLLRTGGGLQENPSVWPGATLHKASWTQLVLPLAMVVSMICDTPGEMSRASSRRRQPDMLNILLLSSGVRCLS